MEQKDSSVHEIVWAEQKSKMLWDFYGSKIPENQYFSFHSGRYILDFVSRYLKLSKMKTILDFGCGPGYLFEHLLKFMDRNAKYYALDFSKDSIEQIDRKFGDDPHFGSAGYVQNPPSSFHDSSMDIIFSIELVEHLNDEQLSNTLREIFRLLKPGGHVVITTPNKENLDANKTICPECGCIFHRWQHVRSFTPKNLVSLMNEISFQTVECRETTFAPRSRLELIKKFYWLFASREVRANVQPHLIYIGKKWVI